MKKKIGYVFCILMLVFISGCAMNKDREETLPDVYFEVNVSEEAAAPVGEEQQNVNGMDSVEKRMMLYGNCEFGCGWWLYTVPDREGQDYKMYFFADKSKDYEERYKSFEEIDFNLEQADYVFPDAREPESGETSSGNSQITCCLANISLDKEAEGAI